MIVVAGNKESCCQQLFMCPCTQHDTCQSYASLKFLTLVPGAAAKFFRTTTCNFVGDGLDKKAESDTDGK